MRNHLAARPLIWFQSLILVVFLGFSGQWVAGQPSIPAQPAGSAPSLVPDVNRAVSDSRGGGGQAFQIVSVILRETRRIGLVLPASFAQSASDRRYPVIVVFDGEGYLAPVAAVHEELTRNGQIAESIIVAIENLDAFRGRVRDLTPPGLSVSGSSRNEGGDKFLDFIEQELLPAVDRQFRGGLPRILVGHSSGGILATYAAATRPAFRAVVAIDAPIHLGDDWLAKKLTTRAAAKPTPLRFAYFSARFPWPDAAWDKLATAAPATWKLYREQLKGEGHESVFMLAAYLGLREIFSDYSRLAAPVAPTTSILPYYATLNASLGGTLIPPRRLVRDVVDDLLMEGRGAEAREAYKLLVQGYGEPADNAKLREQIAEVELRPPPTETVEGLLAMPFATPAEAREYIGEWEGDTWMNGDEPRNRSQLLRIKLIDGRLAAETVYRDAPGGMVQTWRYLRVTRGGLTWGYMNGMRPRGMLLFEGKRTGDTLTGTMRFGGINFQRPEGMRHDPISFSFKRVTRGVQ
jgi:hypothetical protein